eukprot:NODE_1425_length_864_cov_98.652646_g1379_i0.p1 GENE.NODE_1425_length_864_cov_98.652646_g1379_i0~~NODE_1425_length_864_cov_98.652646_g1379_i0.p1  ORF type:complete len:262 (+),score=49.93 NODE_1425_length_864_cov_98.652646_g1379_i0:59-844(+)
MKVLCLVALAALVAAKMPIPSPDMGEELTPLDMTKCHGLYNGTYGPAPADGHASSMFNCSQWGKAGGGYWVSNVFIATAINVPVPVTVYSLGWFTGTDKAGRSCTGSLSLYDSNFNLLGSTDHGNFSQVMPHIRKLTVPVGVNNGTYWVTAYTDKSADRTCVSVGLDNAHQYAATSYILNVNDPSPSPVHWQRLSWGGSLPALFLAYSRNASRNTLPVGASCSNSPECTSSCCCRLHANGAQVCARDSNSCANLGGHCLSN